MSTRRSPTVLKDRSASDNNLSSPTNGHQSDLNKSSPSRNGLHKPNKKRSCLDNGRLFLLRWRGAPCWLGLLLTGGILLLCTHAAIEQILQEEDILPTGKRLRMTYDDAQGQEERILFQSIDLDAEKWKVLTHWELFQRAQYRPKPLMMGVLLVPSKDTFLNYNIDRRRSSQLKRLEMPPPDAKASPEKFQIVKINFQDHGDVNYYNTPRQPSKEVEWTFANTQVKELGQGVEEQENIKNSRDYNRKMPDPPPDGCEPQYDWQTQSFPNCNDLHQIDILTRISTLNPAEEPESMLLARGGYRDVWFVEQNDLPPDSLGEVIAMKTLLYEHPWTERNMDRHRRDALATDRLRRSKMALNLFGYCGNTGLYEFADGGSLEDAVDNEAKYEKWTSKTKMKHAYNVARAIADVHNIDHEGLPSMSHTDISMSQFVSTDDGKTFQINDFNRARFLYKSKEDPNQLCKFEVSSNKGKFRSPEEYAYRPETAAIDTYSMGNIFFVILTGSYPFEEASKKDVKEMVKKGQRPEIPSKYLHSIDPLEVALVQAMKKCWVQNPDKRATSREIEQFLRPSAKGLDEEKGEEEDR